MHIFGIQSDKRMSQDNYTHLRTSLNVSESLRNVEVCSPSKLALWDGGGHSQSVTDIQRVVDSFLFIIII